MTGLQAFLVAVIRGVVEGLTEFLPISFTGLSSFCSRTNTAKLAVHSDMSPQYIHYLFSSG
jgi:undecaprenyl pyrophosphate phosphatase UppP